MRNDAWGDVLKVWLYAAASVCLGAWMSPLLYNAGKALAEVASTRSINDPLDWLAALCLEARFVQFHQVAVVLAALGLFFPWMEWVHTRRGAAAASGGPWRLRLPDGARVEMPGQRLERNPRGLWHALAGFLIVAGLLLPLSLAMGSAGLSALHKPPGNLLPWLANSLLAVFLLALVMEVFFRGIVMGIFLRAMRPAAALGMTAAFFALAVVLFPHGGVDVADPEAKRSGFELLGILARRFGDISVLLENFLPLVVLGGVLAYARWRTASLWLPTGLCSGWWFTQRLGTHFGYSIPADTTAGHGLSFDSILPVAAILLTGVLVHILTTAPAGENDDAPNP